MFAFGRLLSVFLAIRLTPAFMMCCGAIGSFVAILIIALTMLVGPFAFGLLVGAALFGLFLSNATPSVVSLCEQNLSLNRMF